MEYISHEGYKKMLGSFGKEVPKKALTEGLEKEGNAFTAGLAKTKKGGEFKVGNKSFKDKTNYDAPVNEYQFDQMYPDDPGPFEGLDAKLKEFLAKEDDVNWEAVDDNEAEENQTDNGIEEEVEGDAEVLGHVKYSTYKIKSPSGKVVEVEFEGHMEEEVDPPYVWAGWMDGTDGEYDYYMDCDFIDAGGGDYDEEPDYKSLEWSPVRVKESDPMGQQAAGNPDEEKGMRDSIVKREGINLPSSQATGQTLKEKTNSLAHLTSEERDQLRQYVETIKTVKSEIKKMVGKQDMEEGGDTTGLVMKPTTVSEDDMEQGGDKHEDIEKALGAKHQVIHNAIDKIIQTVKDSGFSEGDAALFLQHEIEEKAKQYATSQYDSN